LKHFLKLGDGIDVLPLLLQLQRQPELWGSKPERQVAPGTPHSAMTDIWVRYNDDAPFRNGDISWAAFNQPHFPIWYPAYYQLPAIRPLLFFLAARNEATMIGGVLITRIPPGGVIEPHADTGWHVEHFNTKLYVVLQGNDQCVNRVEDEFVTMRTGEVWYFDNTKEHEVRNNGKEDRITLIVCLRCEP